MSSRVEKFKRDLCKILGHDFREIDYGGWVSIDKKCRRCNTPYLSTVIKKGMIGGVWGGKLL